MGDFRNRTPRRVGVDDLVAVHHGREKRGCCIRAAKLAGCGAVELLAQVLLEFGVCLKHRMLVCRWQPTVEKLFFRGHRGNRAKKIGRTNQGVIRNLVNANQIERFSSTKAEINQGQTFADIPATTRAKNDRTEQNVFEILTCQFNHVIRPLMLQRVRPDQ